MIHSTIHLISCLVLSAIAKEGFDLIIVFLMGLLAMFGNSKNQVQIKLGRDREIVINPRPPQEPDK